MDIIADYIDKDIASNYDFRVKLSDICSEEAIYGILIIGVDEFKRINNLYTYSTGDSVLKIFSEEIKKLVCPKTVMYRLDGDKFGFIIKNESEEFFCDFYEKIKDIAQYKIIVNNMHISLSLSGGLCFYPENGNDGEVLHKNVRIALVNSKDKGGNRLTVLSPSLLHKMQHSMELLERLKESVQNNCKGFYLKYQPLMYAKTGELYGCEALLRWEHSVFPVGVSPVEFIPVLEDHGMIMDVGKWILKTALKQLSEWIEIMPNFQLSVNASSIQFEDPSFKYYVIDILSFYNINPSLLTIELTESGQINNIKYVREVFDFLRSQGIKIALDDFGTGYASLEIFRDLSADELKIDRSFLERITYDVTDQKIISQVIKLCESMNMAVCVEGIETKEIENIAKQFDCKLLQGYFYDKPLTSEEFFEKYLINYSNRNIESALLEVSELENSLSYSAFKPAKPMSLDEIVNNAYSGIFQVGLDREFTFLTCNEGYRRMLGYTAKEMEELFKNHALGFVHPDDREYVNEEIRRQLGYGDTITIEFRLVKSDGKPMWIFGTGNVVKGKYGSSSLVVVIVDNDDIKNKQLSVEKEKQLLSKVINRVPTGIKYLRYDKDFTIEYLSEGFLSFVGYSREEIQSIFDAKYINLIYEEDRKKVIKDVLDQVKLGNVLTLHYRVYCKDGSLMWLETISQLYPADEDGIQRCCSSVVNVSSTITSEERNRSISIAARFQQAAQKWGDIIFEIDFTNKKVFFSENFETVFGRKPSDSFELEMLTMHPDDKIIFEDALKQIYKGDVPSAMEIRVLDNKKTYIWCSIMFNHPDAIGDAMISVIGKITNIDKEKQKQFEMIESLQKDDLTTLYNKNAIETRANSIIQDSSENVDHALFIIDIDNFKLMNEKYGHGFGDEILRIIAKRIVNMFKETDLVARSGGDEFMAFISYDYDENMLIEKVKKLSESLSSQIKIDETLCNIKTSIGIASAKKELNTFYELYCNADIALYRAKEMTQGGYVIV